MYYLGICLEILRRKKERKKERKKGREKKNMEKYGKKNWNMSLDCYHYRNLLSNLVLMFSVWL
jgi:hypothetical protein